MSELEQMQKDFDRFRRDIAEHKVTILRDDGLYRHLRCRQSDSYAMGFDVITWPEYLCYAGDMGCFVFTRVSDMFEFFRGRDGAVLDRGYLAEKAVAVDKPDGLRAYSPELFRAAVKADFKRFAADLSEDERDELRERLEDEVLSRAEDGRDVAVTAAMDFEFNEPGRRPQQVFVDFWEHCLDRYTARFWWCCYAVPWAVAQYDAAKAQAQDAPAVTA